MLHSELVATLVLLSVPNLLAQSGFTQDSVANARANPNDEQAVGMVVGALNRTSDTGLQNTLKELFQKSTARRVRQTLALTLLQHGESEQAYFDELKKYALEAITTTAPLPVEYDHEGNAVKDHVAPTFQAWCESNNFELKECLAMVLDYPLDVSFLAQAKDRRAIPLLRQALGVVNHATVLVAIKGLAALDDNDSISVIAQNLSRFQGRRAELIAAALADFDDPRVGPILDRFITDGPWRQELDDSIRKRRDLPK